MEALYNQIIVTLLISAANAHLLPYIALAVSVSWGEVCHEQVVI